MSVQESCWKQRQPGGLPVGWCAAVPPVGWARQSGLAWAHRPSVPLHRGRWWQVPCTLCLLEESIVRSGSWPEKQRLCRQVYPGNGANRAVTVIHMSPIWWVHLNLQMFTHNRDSEWIRFPCKIWILQTTLCLLTWKFRIEYHWGWLAGGQGGWLYHEAYTQKKTGSGSY